MMCAIYMMGKNIFWNLCKKSLILSFVIGLVAVPVFAFSLDTSVYVPAPSVPSMFSGDHVSPVLPSIHFTPIPSVAVTPPATSVSIYDPSKTDELFRVFGTTAKPDMFLIIKGWIQSDAHAFNVAISSTQLNTATNFVVYGASTETMKLGSGERRAVLRDYFETVGRGDVVWDDIQRMTIGQKPVKRNLQKEQARVTSILQMFEHIVGRVPDFRDKGDDLAWNTLMYRIRFPRDLAKERKGILLFQKTMSRSPSSPLDWSAVRMLGYLAK